MKTIVLTNHYEDALLDILNKIIDGRFNLVTLENVSKRELVDIVWEADYILSSGRLAIDEEVISHAKKLCMVQRTGVGIDRIDIDALSKMNIPLYVNAGVNAQSVAEYTIMLMLCCLKNSEDVALNMRNGLWNKTSAGVRSHEIKGKTVGIIGMGNVGKLVAQMLYGFGANVIYFSRTRLSYEMELELHISYKDFEELIKLSDIITLHCPYDRCLGTMITENTFEMMRDGVILINTARGKLIDEKALISAVKNNKLSGCGIDTFDEEPLPDDSELRSLKQVILSPHIAGLTIESYERMFEKAIDNIWKFEIGDKESIAAFLYK